MWKYLLIGLLFIALGLFMLLKPEKYFEIVERWNFRNDAEPSDFYLANTRFGGTIFTIIGILCIAAFFFA